MADFDVAWAAGAFSAYGIAERKGKKPSLMIRGFTDELPERLVEGLKLGRVEGGVMPRWVCDEPHEVAAFYRLVGPHVVASRKKMIESVWKAWRVWMQEKRDEDPGWIEDYGHAEVQEAVRKRRPTWPTYEHADGELEAWEESK